MSSEAKILEINSSRFGQLTVPEDSLLHFPSGIIGFPTFQRFVMLEHKPPFSWLHSVEDPSLAFVVVDGFEFGDQFKVEPPWGDKDIDLQQGDEYALLVIVTIRSDPRQTTANLKAPVFVNMRNRKAVQVIFDSAKFSTRFPLWVEQAEPAKEIEPKK